MVKLHVGMTTVRGRIKNGMVLPLEPVKPSDEGRNVIITFVDDQEKVEVPRQALSLKALVDEFQVDTGIEDLAAQHDHYLYGTRKK